MTKVARILRKAWPALALSAAIAFVGAVTVNAVRTVPVVKYAHQD